MHAGAFRHGILDVSWSLAIEEQFYILWPAFVLLLSRKLLIAATVAIFVASAVCRCFLLHDSVSPIALYVLTLTRLEPIAAGAALAILLRSDVDVWRCRALAYTAFGLSVFSLAIIFVSRNGLEWSDPIVCGVGLVFIAVACSALVLRIAIHSSIPSKLGHIFESQVFTTLGKYSYAMYLFHLPIRAAIRDLVFPPSPWEMFPSGALSAQAIFYGLSISVTFAAAWASFHLYEIHFLKLKRYFPMKDR